MTGRPCCCGSAVGIWLPLTDNAHDIRSEVVTADEKRVEADLTKFARHWRIAMKTSLSITRMSAAKILSVCALLLTSLPTHLSFAEENAAGVIASLGLRESAIAARDMKEWEKPHKIVVLSDSTSRIARLQEVANDVSVVGARNRAEAMAQIVDADGLIGNCSPDLVNAGAKLRWIQTQSAGVENCLTIPKLRDGNVILTNMQRVNAPNISEHAMALILALTRQINAYLANQSEGKWERRPQEKLMDLDGHTMLVVGLGGIGTTIAERAHAFGMHVIATRASGHEGPSFVDYVGVANELPKLIGRADIVVNVTPLTPETTGLFNAAMFERMKASSYLINVGRGKSVITDDLVAALNTGHIAGAGLDVVDPEPLPKDHPLWNIPNVVITPHVAGDSELKRDHAWLVIRENLRRYVAGDKLFSVVDAKRGY
jgi:phosphoglycerate dehydrogenase-like enzyme